MAGWVLTTPSRARKRVLMADRIKVMTEEMTAVLSI